MKLNGISRCSRLSIAIRSIISSNSSYIWKLEIPLLFSFSVAVNPGDFCVKFETKLGRGFVEVAIDRASSAGTGFRNIFTMLRTPWAVPSNRAGTSRECAARPCGYEFRYAHLYGSSPSSPLLPALPADKFFFAGRHSLSSRFSTKLPTKNVHTYIYIYPYFRPKLSSFSTERKKMSRKV